MEKKVETVYYGDAKSNFSMKWNGENMLYILIDEPEYPNSNRSIELEMVKRFITKMVWLVKVC